MAALDRRRANPPTGGTRPPVFLPTPSSRPSIPPRTTNEIRKIFLRTNLVPSASGSSYLELSPPTLPGAYAGFQAPPSLKLAATAHGPRPLPRTHPFTPTLLVTATVKFAPFSTAVRRGYVRDAAERDLGARLESALRAVVLADRWPKSGVEVVVTILEGEADGPWALMGALAGCVSAGMAALAAAGVACADVAAGGVAALVRGTLPEGLADAGGGGGGGDEPVLVLDPPFAALDPGSVVAACAVGYLPARDEVGECWVLGDLGMDGGEKRLQDLVDGAARAAGMAAGAVREAVREGLGIPEGGA